MFIAPIHLASIFIYIERACLDFTKENKGTIFDVDLRSKDHYVKTDTRNLITHHYSESIVKEPILEDFEYIDSTYVDIEIINPIYKEVVYDEVVYEDVAYEDVFNNKIDTQNPINTDCNLIPGLNRSISHLYKDFSLHIKNVCSEPNLTNSNHLNH